MRPNVVICLIVRQSKGLLGKYNKLKIMIGFLTDYCKLTEHLRNLNIEIDGTCKLCKEEAEKAIHLLTDCGALFHIMFGRVLSNGKSNSITRLSNSAKVS